MALPLRMSDDDQPPLMQALTVPLGPQPQPDLSPFGGSQTPNVTSPRMQREEQLQSRMSSYDNPKQPQGFWGHLGHGLNVLRNVAETALTPTIAAADPTSMLSQRIQRNQEGRELDKLQGEDTLEKRQAQQEARANSLNEAQTGHLNAETDELQNPKPEPLQHIETDQGIFALNPRTSELTPLTFGGKPLMKPQADQKPESPVVDLQRQIAQAEEKGDQQTAHTLQQRLKDLNPQAEQRFSFQVGEAGKKEGEQGQKQDLETRKEAYKAWQPALDSAERFNVMAKNYEDAAGPEHNQQAMLSLLANHLGMTMGLQKGARMTKDIIHEAEQSRPWLQGMQSKFDDNGYLKGVTLTAPQMRQMVDLAHERYSEDVGKSRSAAGYLGAKDEGPDRKPNASVVRYYLHQAGGDAEKAKQMAAEAGWTK